MADQIFCWLIELGSDPPTWWTGRGLEDFTSVADGGTHQAPALRFARFTDAEVARCYLVDKKMARGCKCVEHGFVEPEPRG